MRKSCWCRCGAAEAWRWKRTGAVLPQPQAHTHFRHTRKGDFPTAKIGDTRGEGKRRENRVGTKRGVEWSEEQGRAREISTACFRPHSLARPPSSFCFGPLNSRKDESKLPPSFLPFLAEGEEGKRQEGLRLTFMRAHPHPPTLSVYLSSLSRAHANRGSLFAGLPFFLSHHFGALGCAATILPGMSPPSMGSSSTSSLSAAESERGSSTRDRGSDASPVVVSHRLSSRGISSQGSTLVVSSFRV